MHHFLQPKNLYFEENWGCGPEVIVYFYLKISSVRLFEKYIEAKSAISHAGLFFVFHFRTNACRDGANVRLRLLRCLNIVSVFVWQLEASILLKRPQHV